MWALRQAWSNPPGVSAGCRYGSQSVIDDAGMKAHMSQEAPQANGRPDGGGARRDAGRRVYLLSAGLLVVLALLAPIAARNAPLHPNGLLPVWMIVAIFAVCTIF